VRTRGGSYERFAYEWFRRVRRIPGIQDIKYRMFKETMEMLRGNGNERGMISKRVRQFDFIGHHLTVINAIRSGNTKRSEFIITRLHLSSSASCLPIISHLHIMQLHDFVYLFFFNIALNLTLGMQDLDLFFGQIFFIILFPKTFRVNLIL